MNVKRDPSRFCRWRLALAVLALQMYIIHALDNGVGQTPAMGWNSWNRFRCDIHEKMIREVADAMVSSGLRDAGYKYVNIDDCWMHKRNSKGEIVPFVNKFPSGMKALGDYLHARGLKFGVYSDTGNTTCEGYPGSWGHEKQDALTYASWGVDYLKFDYCAMDRVRETPKTVYSRMRDALNATGRPILYSLCNWGTGQPHLWGAEVGNSWRTGRDVFASWERSDVKALHLPNFLQSVLEAVDVQESYHPYAQPGAFNDADMLVVGLEGMYPYGIVDACPEHVKGCRPGQYVTREAWGQVGGLTVTEQRAHFALWCMMANPLILGNDPRDMSKQTIQILLAKEIIAINQDPLGRQGHRVHVEPRHEGRVEIWRKPLAHGRFAIMVLNGAAQQVRIRVSWSRDIGEAAHVWNREAAAVEDPCQDKDKNCPSWAAGGECEKNAGFMMGACLKSCPNACDSPDDLGPQATALVRDAWMESNVGMFTGGMEVTHVEAHEARVYVVEFVEPGTPMPVEDFPKPFKHTPDTAREQERSTMPPPRSPEPRRVDDVAAILKQEGVDAGETEVTGGFSASHFSDYERAAYLVVGAFAGILISTIMSRVRAVRRKKSARRLV
ncbi:hypothetical protein CYMTET_35318 [Cymbomonas tetramitiformis]|uniref:Alpha-galactosidase n=1 Tax=Cymbomonas tetramitiformis TaxID=36881 RepID=A0AAE0F9T1_9CHLO|nr:hypothetical protein CYMTET_35318 [Cymbomonas tetramitiformis]